MTTIENINLDKIDPRTIIVCESCITSIINLNDRAVTSYKFQSLQASKYPGYSTISRMGDMFYVASKNSIANTIFDDDTFEIIIEDKNKFITKHLKYNKLYFVPLYDIVYIPDELIKNFYYVMLSQELRQHL